MKKSLFDPDRLVFAGLTCLVASILLAIMLVFRASYAPVATRMVESTKITIHNDSKPEATRSQVVTPPTLPENLVYTVEITFGPTHQIKQGNAFCVQGPAGRRFLFSHASLITQSEWQQVSQVILKSRDNLPLNLEDVNPLYLGPFTEDHQPNMLSNPDLGQDLVIWSMPNASPGKGLTLASQAAVPGEVVWIAARPEKNTNAQSHFRCHVLEHTKHALSLQPLDRCPLDHMIGLPVVNQRGEIIGNVLGGNDLTLIGTGHQGLENQLKRLQLK